MEKSWKFACLCLIVSLLKLCNGLPIHLERTITDPRVQVATGLVAIVLAVCAVLFLTGCLCCRRFKGFQEFRDSPIPISTTVTVDNGLVNPTADGAFTIFAPLSQHNNTVSNPKFHLDDYIYGDINVSSWFNEEEHDFQRSKLKYIRELGKGWFGKVVEGTAQDLENRDGWTSVVVRILDSTASTKERIFFLHEADIYRCGEHTNILKLYGRCLDSVPLLLLQEFCPQGDLKSYLLSNKSNQKNLLASEYPLIWCCQITSAVKFLHEKGLAHSDLACRNCQLTSNLTLKLGDYGLAPTKYPEDYYEGVPSISVRWCAPESLRHTNTTIQSERVTREANVWTLAVCFWEVCECGKRPYQDLSDDEVVTQVLGRASARLPRPSHGVLYTDYIYSLMQSCWLTPESRPTPTQIYLTLTDLLQVFTVCKAESQNSVTSTQDSQESFDMRWNSLKPNNANSSDTSTELMDDLKVSQMSPSLNNLIGSLEDVDRLRSFEVDVGAALVKSAPAPTCQTFEFKLGPLARDPPFDSDSLNDSMIYSMRRSSSSETEEENWKTKIERGAYTEKVRQKSRSVTDLMVLTHIDCSESESETPLPSLDLNGGRAVNYNRNVRLAPKKAMERSYVHGSEGNLLSVQDDFQAELKKLQEEHRDSLFFVPDKFVGERERLRMDEDNMSAVDMEKNSLMASSSERLIDELNGTSEMKPSNQIYNVFKVTIDKLSPVHIVRLNEIINLEESAPDKNVAAGYEVPKLCDIIENNNSNVSDFLCASSGDGDGINVDDEVCGNDVGEAKELKNDDESCEKNKTSLANLNCRLSEKIQQKNEEEVSECLEKWRNGEENLVYNMREPEDDSLIRETMDEESKKVDKCFEMSELEKFLVNERKLCDETNVKPKNECYEEVKVIKNERTECFPSLKHKGETVKDILNKPENEAISSEISKNEEIDEKSNVSEETLSLFEDVHLNDETEEKSKEIKQHKITEEKLTHDTFNESLKNDGVDEDFHQIEELRNENGKMKIHIEKEEKHKMAEEELKNEFEEKHVNNGLVSCEQEEKMEKMCLNHINIEEKEEIEVMEEKVSGVTVEDSLKNGEVDEKSHVNDVFVEENSKKISASIDVEAEKKHETQEEEFDNREENKNSKSRTCTKQVMENNEKELDTSTNNSFTSHNEEITIIVRNISPETDVESVNLNEECQENRSKLNVNLINEAEIVSNEETQWLELDNKMESEETTIKVPEKSHEPIDHRKEKPKKLYQVPKLIELIENNDTLMDYIIANYESELHDDLSWENSCKTNSNNQTNYDDITSAPPTVSVNFDVSADQEASNPNAMTHLNVFSVSKTKQRSLDVLTTSTPSKNSFSSLRDVDVYEQVSGVSESPNLNYSLETWDNFLGDAIDYQNQTINNEQTVIFGSLSSEPRSLVYLEEEEENSEVGGATPPNSDMESSIDDRPLVDVYADHPINIQDEDCLNETFVVGDKTRVGDDNDVSTRLNGTFKVDDRDSKGEAGTWEPNGGWFLHPQTCANVSGQMTEQKGDNDSYVRFGMDEEILAALRGELLAKLPHAQGSSVDKTNRENEDDEWETTSDKDEVFLRYNVYNTPLSPIPEESEDEDMISSGCTTPGSPASNLSVDDDEDWPDKTSPYENPPQDNDSQSLKAQGFRHQQTLSQDSCCSNDTLFNLEEMTCVAVIEQEKEQQPIETSTDIKIKEAIDYFKGQSPPLEMIDDSPTIVQENGYLVDFLDKEIEHASLNKEGAWPRRWAGPLPSPDERPWRQLSESFMLSNKTMTGDDEEQDVVYENVAALPMYANLGEAHASTEKHEVGGSVDGIYENVGDIDEDDDVIEVDYVNVVGEGEGDEGLSKVESVGESFFPERASGQLRSADRSDDLTDVANEADGDSEMFGVLTDIRFSGPGESHLMSTSFSESNNDPNNEQDWDSGSDTRSSSSGEFIWKEGEHEESLKALQALPQDTLEDRPKNKMEEGSSSESSCSDEDGECPEFIPSAWDKYATPTKSALRSPEKTLEKEEKKKGVWFKKQRYHCVYEYPREPDSPILQSFDLWNSPPAVTTYPEWYFDIDSGTEFSDFVTSSSDQPDTNENLMEFRTNFNDEFYITSSATPFDMEGVANANSSPSSSQFFPGGGERSCWFDPSKINENTTPDSGVEDITPGSLIDEEEEEGRVPSLKMLAENAYSRSKRCNLANKEESDAQRRNDILGGLRHTRDKLKLDLPPSPNTFTSNKTFNLEDKPTPTTTTTTFDLDAVGGGVIEEPLVLRERPAFTTFGKSRFLVQHVDTPDRGEEEEGGKKNVCFEALPYKPLEKQRCSVKKCKNKEEAGVLDSADEDSGIESSTLERKSTMVIGEIVNKLIVDL